MCLQYLIKTTTCKIQTMSSQMVNHHFCNLDAVVHRIGLLFKREDITAFDGVSVDEQRWVIGSMYSTESPILVSSRTDENAFPALQNEWVRFESMEALGSSKTGSLVDCALQWGDCSQCVGTKPPTTVSSI